VRFWEFCTILLPLPRRIMLPSWFFWLFVSPFVSIFVQKLPNGFAWNFQGRLTMGRDHHQDTGSVSRNWYDWQIGKAWLRCNYDVITSPADDSATATALTQRAVSPAHDIARLVRLGLAEVCTVPVLLVIYWTLTMCAWLLDQSPLSGRDLRGDWLAWSVA